MINQRAQTMGMTTANFEQGDVAMMQYLVVGPNKVGDEHALSRPLDEDRCVGEEQIGMLCTQVSGDEALSLRTLPEDLRQVDHRRHRYFCHHAGR